MDNSLVSNIISVAAIALYVSTSVILLTRLLRATNPPTTKSAALTTGLAAVLLHGYLITHSLFGASVMNFGFFHAASLVGLLVSLILLLTSIRAPVENLGIIILPIAAMAIGLERFLPSERFVPTDAPWQLQAHIVVSIIAYSLFTLAMGQAILLAIQERQLRNKQPGGFMRALPPLQSMEILLFELIVVGFVLLTVGLLTGLLFIDDIFAKHRAHKTVLSIIAWVLFAILLWGRHQFGWRGRTAIRWTLWGFFTLMLAYFGSKLVLELVLGR